MKTADRHGRSVLITGSSSGIGRATAVHLARKGFTVFATVRKEADAEKLRGLGVAGLVPLYPLDLAKPEQIPAINEAVERIKDGTITGYVYDPVAARLVKETL
ncbi:MAG: SDR family NAD(P)-dependent oxidoreductase [Candidatus Aminicenantales bacterium]